MPQISIIKKSDIQEARTVSFLFLEVNVLNEHLLNC